ncbi:MAG: XdhC family protein [Deltaproteobacteria bacterium]|nr:XdhC family protein [Deltaproteobacteria bacterium]
MEGIYNNALELLDKRQIGILATIIRLTGSGPRAAGAKFLIMENGSFIGTIGGGLLEAEVLKKAKHVLKTARPCRMHLSLMGKDVAETDMICGGDAEVLLEPLFPDDEAQIAILKRCLGIRKRGGAGLLATVVNVERWGKEKSLKVLFEKSGQRAGGLPGMESIEESLVASLEKWLERREPAITVFKDKEGKQVELFVEPLFSDPLLYIFGGGHVSTQIVPLASGVGFKAVVIDDRAEFADPARFPKAEEVCCCPFERVMERFPINKLSYIIIVTRGHLNDKMVLEQALRTGARYIGMIGSRRKKAMIYERLLVEGFTREDLNRVCAPIGLDIGAETTEEIAVSIVAQLIQVRAGKVNEQYYRVLSKDDE